MGFYAAFSGSNLNSLTKSSTVCEYDGTTDGAGNLIDISWAKQGYPGSRPALNLAPVGAPSTVYSSLESQGNRLAARGFDGSQFYWRAHQESMNVFDSDFSLTIVAKTSADLVTLFAHGAGSGASGGFWVFSRFGSTCYTRSYSAGSLYVYTENSGLNAGMYNIVQIVRSNNYINVWINGSNPYEPVSVAGYGIDGGFDLNIGKFYSSSPNYLNGSVVYVRLDSSALTTQQRINDYESIRSINSSAQGKTPWIFTRSTTAYRDISTSGIFNTPSGVPRIGGNGGGLLIEPAATNYALQANDLTTTWTSVALTSISSNVFMAPDDTQTMDGIIADANDTQHGVSQVITHTVAPWVFSGYWSPGDQAWAKLENTTVANAYAYFKSTGVIGTVGAGCLARMDPAGYRNGQPSYRLQIGYTGTAAAHTVRALAAPADADDDFVGDATTPNAYFWGMQCEPGVQATSLIPTTTISVSRATDLLTVPATAFLPALFDPILNSKLTVEFEAQIFDNGGVIGSVKPFRMEETNTKNSLSLYKSTTYSALYWDVFFNDSTEKYIVISPPSNIAGWHRYKLFLDLAALTRSYVQIDGGAKAYFASGTTQTLNLTSALMTMTQYGSTGTAEGFKIRNLRIDNKEW